MEILNSMNWKRIKTLAETMPFYFYVPIAYLFIVIVGIPLEYFSSLLNIPDKEISSQLIPDNFLLKMFLVVIFAPVLETFLTQALPFHFLSLFKFMNRNKWLMILISGAIFGSVHVFSLQHIIYATTIGFFLMATYILRSKKGDSFLCTFSLHAFFNLVAILLSQFS